MSFVSFPANYAGSPPAPFAAFDAGEIVFYLVGTVDGASPLPAPGAQLSVFKDTTKGSGRNPVDTVTETAKGWRGRRRITVATRTYSWSRFTRGALAAARESAQWTDPQGAPLAVWSNLVSVDDANALGYRTPRGRLNAARPGRRGVGVENNARGTVRGRSIAVAQASTPAPVAPAPAVPVPTPGLAPAVPQGLASLVQDAAQSVDAVREAARPLPGWAQSMARNPRNVRARAEAQAAREAQAAQNAARREAQAQAERDAAQAGRMAHAGAERFASLDLGSAPAPVDSGPCAGAERFASLDLD
jgi:hypothetical protein